MYLVDLLTEARKDPKKYEGTKWQVAGCTSALRFETGTISNLRSAPGIAQEFEFNKVGDMIYDGHKLLTYSDTQVAQVFKWVEVDFTVAAKRLEQGKLIKRVDTTGFNHGFYKE